MVGNEVIHWWAKSYIGGQEGLVGNEVISWWARSSLVGEVINCWARSHGRK